jgi:hypothetical protein
VSASTSPTGGGPGALADDARRARLEANARGYAEALREVQPLVAASRRHSDQMLTWAIGIMGAGLFALPGLLKELCRSTPPDIIWYGVAWAFGILTAILGRLTYAWLRDADDMAFLHKIHAVEGALLAGLDVAELSQRVLAIMNDLEPGVDVRVRKSRRLRYWADGLYYATHIALGIGFVVIFWRVTAC